MVETLRPLLLLVTARAWFRFVRRLGMPGLFLMSALDSSFLVLPFGNDLLLIALVSSRRDSLIWIAYVLVSAVGSVVGVLVIDLLMRKAGEKGLERFVSARKIERWKTKLENKLGITVFVATLLPPPFPFTPVIMTASALQCSRRKLFGAVFVGRLIRFTVEAILALYFGRQVIAYIDSDAVAYFVYGLIAVAVVLSTLSLLRWLRRS
ncbi:MAG TPA: VTT domain-containing protein [Pyrinomonadaceae bacterium]|nr:VTT domain-containing protein [Pyrinomonadaceae bacterium]